MLSLLSTHRLLGKQVEIFFLYYCENYRLLYRGILMANTLLSKITQSDYERARVMERERILTDYYSDLDDALISGMQQGKQEGKQEGIKERNAEIVSSMKLQGFSVDQISNITGLTEDEIEKL